MRGCLCYDALCLAAFCLVSLAIQLTSYTKDSTLHQVFFPSKCLLSGMNKAVFPCWPVTCGKLLAHTKPVYLLKKNIHLAVQIQPMAGSFDYHVSVFHCTSLRVHILFWHCCFDTSILQLRDTRQLEIGYVLAHVGGKFMAKYVLISFLAQILELLLACTCLH